MLIIDFKYLWKHSEKFPSAPEINQQNQKQVAEDIIKKISFHREYNFVTIASGNGRDLVKRKIIHQSTKTK